MSYDQKEYSPSSNNYATVSLVSGIIGWLFFVMFLCSNFLLVPFAFATLGFGAIAYICLIPFGCVPPIAWVVAVITGNVSNNQAKNNGLENPGIARAGLIMGYIGVGLVVITTCIGLILVVTGSSIPILSEILNEIQY